MGPGKARGGLRAKLSTPGQPRPPAASPAPSAWSRRIRRRLSSEPTAMALCERAASGSSLLWPRVVLFGDSITQVPAHPGLRPGACLGGPGGVPLVLRGPCSCARRCGRQAARVRVFSRGFCWARARRVPRNLEGPERLCVRFPQPLRLPRRSHSEL